MAKIKGKLLTLIIICCALTMIIVFVSISDGINSNNTKQISLIVYDSESADWDNLRQGAEQACEGENAEISLCGISSYNDAKGQIDVINREIQNGADALMIAACDSEQIGKYLDETQINIPIVLVKNGVISEEEYDFVSNDDYSMGRLLGETLTEKENPIVKVAIISDGLEKTELVKRKQGVLEVIEPYVNKIIIWERDEEEKQLITRKFIQNKLLEEAVDVVVALDNSSSDALMDALENLNRNTKAYIISNSDESVYYLDKGKVKCLEYSDEFEIGYVGAKYLLDRKEAKKLYENKEIKYQIISKDNMYDKDIQTFIFPFVK